MQVSSLYEFCELVLEFLGQKIRVVIPSRVVLQIHWEFPDAGKIHPRLNLDSAGDDLLLFWMLILRRHDDGSTKIFSMIMSVKSSIYPVQYTDTQKKVNQYSSFTRLSTTVTFCTLNFVVSQVFKCEFFCLFIVLKVPSCGTLCHVQYKCLFFE